MTASFGASAARGMLWMTLSVLVVKGASLLLQIVLGKLLSPQDYGVFALVSVALTFVSSLQSTGANKILIQQRDQYAALARPYTDFSFYIGIVAMLAMTALGFGFARFYHDPVLTGAIALSALSLPFASLAGVPFARLSIDLRFRYFAQTDFLVAAVNFVVTALAAWLGAHFYSVGLGLVASAILRYALFLGAAKSPWPGLGLSPRDFVTLLDQVKWLIALAFFGGLAQQGDYFVLGRMLDVTLLGYYYFGFQLTANIGQLVAQGIGGTLFPLFTALRDDAAEMRRAFLRSSGLICFASCVLCLAAIGGLPWVVHVIWHGKWDMATFTAIAIATTLPMRMMSPMAAVALDSHGKWRLRTLLLGFDAGSMMAAAVLGARVAGLPGAAVGVAAQRLVSAVVDFTFALRAMGDGARTAVRFILRSFGAFVLPAAGLVAYNLHGLPAAGGLRGFADACGASLAGILIFIAIGWMTDRETLVWLYAAGRRRLGRARS